MRTASFLGRLCFRNGLQRFRLTILRNRQCHPPLRASIRKSSGSRAPIAKTILLAALSPAAFVKLSEEDTGDGKTGEQHMLEASRAEIQKGLPDNIHGFRRAWRGVFLLVDQYIYEPIATGFRFLHLVLIFVPVILAVPVTWLGARQKDRDDERSGTLWWYGFLVRSMERAGPAFIKVATSMSCYALET